MNLQVFRGVAARMIARQHLTAVGFIMLVLLIIAYSIDLSKYLGGVRSYAAEHGQPVPTVLAEYLLYRGTDIVTRLLPMACLGGAFLAEIMRQQRMEDVVLFAAGASPRLAFGALAGVAIVLGAFLFMLEGWARPAAVFAQVDMKLGAYGRRFAEKETEAKWFVIGDRALSARLWKSGSPELREFRLFEGVNKDNLQSVIFAKTARPHDEPQQWQLEDAVIWTRGENDMLLPKHMDRMAVQFPLTPANVRYEGIQAYYLPWPDLKELASLADVTDRPDAHSAIVRRFTAFLLPGVFLFFGVTLATAGRSGRMLAPYRLLPLAVLGYITLVSVKVFWALGENGYMGPVSSSVWPMALAVLATVLLQMALAGRLGRKRK